jgi:hypothetical protein
MKIKGKWSSEELSGIGGYYRHFEGKSADGSVRLFKDQYWKVLNSGKYCHCEVKVLSAPSHRLDEDGYGRIYGASHGEVEILSVGKAFPTPEDEAAEWNNRERKETERKAAQRIVNQGKVDQFHRENPWFTGFVSSSFGKSVNPLPHLRRMFPIGRWYYDEDRDVSSITWSELPLRIWSKEN